jgi:4-amino-4-deoxy-L-arabinose transferase-like glycosyltransferase
VLSSAPASEDRGAAIARLATTHWQLLAVLGAFVISTFIVPTLAPVAISDDWVYIRSVEILLEQGRFQILTIASSNLLFQVVWGALFALLFGPSLGVLRLSMVVLWFISAFACYGLLWELSRDRARSALGTAIYLFNPLGYSLAFTFMTDAPFLSMLVISLYCYVRGVGTGLSTRWTIAGSVAAACAVLVRQPGALIPFAVVVALIAAGHIRPNWRGLRTTLEVAAFPALVYIAFYVWLRFVHGEPQVHQTMRAVILNGGWSEVRLHAIRLYIVEAVYLGLFLLPLAAGALVGLRKIGSDLSPRGWAWFVGWQAFVVAGVAGFWAIGARMPYIPHFLSPAGIGPNDLMAARPALYTGTTRDVVTIVCAVAALIVGLAVIRGLVRWRERTPEERRAVALLIGLLVINSIAALIVSSQFRNWRIENQPAPSLDRYLLPVLPVAIGLVLWALRDVRFSLQLGWIVAIFLALFSVAGTRDNIAFHQAQWELAREANAIGVKDLYLDAGASWDGYFLGEVSLRELGYFGGPGHWWLALYAPIIDPRYAVSTQPVPRYSHVVLVKEYDLWLDSRPARLLLLRRDDIPGPP